MSTSILIITILSSFIVGFFCYPAFTILVKTIPNYIKQKKLIEGRKEVKDEQTEDTDK